VASTLLEPALLSNPFPPLAQTENMPIHKTDSVKLLPQLPDRTWPVQTKPNDVRLFL